MLANGCGSYGYIIDFDIFQLYGFNQCCNEHDTCYSICRTSNRKCDSDFKMCLLKKSKDNFSLQVINFIDIFVQEFGCTFFINSQKNVCIC